MDLRKQQRKKTTCCICSITSHPRAVMYRQLVVLVACGGAADGRRAAASLLATQLKAWQEGDPVPPRAGMSKEEEAKSATRRRAAPGGPGRIDAGRRRRRRRPSPTNTAEVLSQHHILSCLLVLHLLLQGPSGRGEERSDTGMIMILTPSFDPPSLVSDEASLASISILLPEEAEQPSKETLLPARGRGYRSTAAVRVVLWPVCTI